MNILVRCLLPAMLLSSLAAQDTRKPDPPKAWIDPANVDDQDFPIQGEYTGEIDGKRVAVQIRALGDGKFEAPSYQGE